MRTCMLFLIATACGGGSEHSKPPANVARPEPAESSCATMAKHAVGVISAEKENARKEDIAAMTSIVERRCTDDRWTVESRTCLSNAAQRDDVLKCFESLTDEQAQALRRDEKTRMPKHIETGGASVP